MAQKDQFADLFSGSRRNDVNKMSLAERLRQHQTPNLTASSNLNSSWSGLDLLSTSLSSSQSKEKSTSSVNLKDDFDIFGTSSDYTGEKRTPNNTPYSRDGSDSRSSAQLDDIFSTFANSDQLQMQPKKAFNQNHKNNNLFDDDEFTDAFTQENYQEDYSQSSQTPTTAPVTRATTVPAPSESEMYKRDEAISELMEMGFELDVAKRALSETLNYDINEAISIIMNEAHRNANMKTKKNRINQLLPEQDELTLAIQDLTVDIKSKAFSLLSKGRQTLAKGIEMYKDQQFSKNDNQPAWMRNQSTYKQQSINLEGDEDEEELDREKMRLIVERQRALDKQLKEEKEKRSKLQRENSTSSKNSSKFDDPPLRTASSKFNEPISRPRSKFDEPIPRSSSNVRESIRNGRKNDNPVTKIKATEAPKSTAKFEEPAPRRRNKDESPVSIKSTPVPSPEELFDIFNTPIPADSGNKLKLNYLITSVPISTFQLESFQDSRTKGNDFFKKGDFSSSLLKYQDSLSSLPSNHKLSIISLSNISNAQSKLGSSKECLNSINQALSLIDSYGLKINQFNDVEVDDNKPLKPIWLKLVSRKAESLEHLEKFQEALEAYNLCIENGGATKTVLDGKTRVLKVLQPTPRPKSTPKPVKASSRVSASPPKLSENLKTLQSQNLEKEKEDLKRFELHDAVELKISLWKQGKEDNLRALLASLHEILWPELGWKPLSMTDLVLNKKVKINYLKAVAKTHPDKLNNASVEQKMIAQNVFITLNQSWDKFKESNGMN